MSKKWKRGLQVGSQVAISFNYNRYRKYEITTVKSVTEEDGDIKVEVDFAEFYEDSCNIIPITEEIIKIVEAENQIVKLIEEYREKKQALMAERKRIHDDAQEKMVAIEHEIDALYADFDSKRQELEKVVVGY